MKTRRLKVRLRKVKNQLRESKLIVRGCRKRRRAVIIK